MSLPSSWLLRNLGNALAALLRNSVASFGVLKKTSLVKFQVLQFCQSAKKKTCTSKRITGRDFFRKQEGLREGKKREEHVVYCRCRAHDLCVIPLKSRTHLSAPENVTRGCSSSLFLVLEVGPARSNCLRFELQRLYV